MAGIKKYFKYFEDNAEQWLLGGYRDSGYNYPTALHRMRIVSKCIAGLNKKRLRIIDLGCGGGDLAFQLAESGHTVVGVDQSQKMIGIAESRRKTMPEKIRERVRFSREAINENMMSGEKFDVVTAMGLIGYLSTDDVLFKIANGLLKPNGYFLVSARNRLFNIKSTTFRTEREIRNNHALKLVKELNGLDGQITARDANIFISNIKKIVADFPRKALFGKRALLSERAGLPPSALISEPRQSSPGELKAAASKYGFAHKAYYGVHPHLLDPRLNKMLPPQVFNALSSSLEAFEHLPISLAWSSVVIGLFQKRRK